jgi:secreted protein with Ig-like and vWFA domain
MKLLNNLNQITTILGLMKENKQLKMGYMGRRETAIDYITLDELNTLDFEDLETLTEMIICENRILC